MEVSNRLARWIKREFSEGSSGHVLEELQALPEAVVGGQDPERVQTSLVIRAGGDWHAFQRQLRLVASDWRDALVGAGLGDEDWRERLDEVLGAEK